MVTSRELFRKSSGLVLGAFMLYGTGSLADVGPIQDTEYERLLNKQGLFVQCPADGIQWDSWNQRLIWDFMRRESEGELGIEYVRQANKFLQDCLKPIRESATITKEVASCVLPIEQFLARHERFPQGQDPAFSLGFSVSDSDYYKSSEPYLQVPEELKKSEFLENLSLLATAGKAFDYLDGANQIRRGKGVPEFEYVIYRSNVPTFDRARTYARLMVHVPPDPSDEPPVEKWVQFGFPKVMGNGEEVPATQLSIVAVKQGAEGKRGESYLRDLEVVTLPNSTLKTIDPPGKTTNGSCMSCHQSGGPLPMYESKPLAPEYQPLVAAYAGKRKKPIQVLKALNKLIEKQGPLHSPFDPVPTELPALAEKFSSRSDLFFEHCLELFGDGKTENQPDLVARMKSAASCAKCHDGNTRSRLVFPFGAAVDMMVREGHMPANAKLTRPEREIFWACLKMDYHGATTSKWSEMGQLETGIRKSCLTEQERTSLKAERRALRKNANLLQAAPK